MHHLFRAQEILGLTRASVHNLQFYLWLMQEVRDQLDAGTFDTWYPSMVERLGNRL
jgi:queuine tRNA-ribosyltransferase